MGEHKSPIPSMIYNAAVGGHVTNSNMSYRNLTYKRHINKLKSE